jgi:hypothetical protein
MHIRNIENVHAETVYSSDEDDEIKISGKEKNDRTTIIVTSYIDDQDANKDLQHSISSVQESSRPRSLSKGRNSKRASFLPRSGTSLPYEDDLVEPVSRSPKPKKSRINIRSLSPRRKSGGTLPSSLSPKPKAGIRKGRYKGPCPDSERPSSLSPKPRKGRRKSRSVSPKTVKETLSDKVKRPFSISPARPQPKREHLLGRRSSRLRERMSDGSSDEPLCRKSARMREVTDMSKNDAMKDMESPRRRSERLRSVILDENLPKPPKGRRLSRSYRSPVPKTARVDFTGAVIDEGGGPSELSQSNHRIPYLNIFNSFEDNTPPSSSFSMAEKDGRNPSSGLIIDTSLLGCGINEHIKNSRNSEGYEIDGKTEELELTGEAKRGLVGKSESSRSFISVDLEFEGESKFIQLLRYLRILAPYPNEKPIQRRVRFYSWASLFCDFLAALVSITTFNGVSMCCNRPILSVLGNANWNKIIDVITIIYMIMIFVEIVPVVREGMPFNIMNPLLGFMITFAVFFDDNVAEAVTMWVIEIVAITCECLTYRLKYKIYQEKEERINEADKEYRKFKEVKKARKQMKKKGLLSSPSKRSDLSPKRSPSLSPIRSNKSSLPGLRRSLSPVRERTSSTIGLYSEHKTVGTALSPIRKPSTIHFDSGHLSRRPSLSPIRQRASVDMPHSESNHVSADDDTSLDSFSHEEDEMEAQILSPGRYTAFREIRLMRKLRVWRQEQEVQVKHLRYMFGGVVFNIGLVVFTLVLIIMISKNKGLCVVDMTAPAIFASGQLEKCFDCAEVDGTCEICREDGSSHCYYPYY